MGGKGGMERLHIRPEFFVFLYLVGRGLNSLTLIHWYNLVARASDEVALESLLPAHDGTVRYLISRSLLLIWNRTSRNRSYFFL